VIETQWLMQRPADLRQARGLRQGGVAARVGWESRSTACRMEQRQRQRVTRRGVLASLDASGSEDADLRGELIGIWREIRR
jgi:hypothetical protein